MLNVNLLTANLRQTLFIPLIEFGNAFFDFHMVMPSETVQLAHVNELAHSAIGFAGIKGNFALKAYGLDNELGELTDGEFLAGAHVE